MAASVRSRRAALAVLCAADVLVMLDGMVVAVALPSTGRDLGFSAAGLQWVVTAWRVHRHDVPLDAVHAAIARLTVLGSAACATLR